MRKFNRKNNDIRHLEVEKNIIEDADGSCLFTIGKTKVICAAVKRSFAKDVLLIQCSPPSQGSHPPGSHGF